MQANEHLYPTSPSLVIVLTNQIPETAVVDLWSFVEIFSKKLETQNIQIGSSIVTLLKDFRSQFYFRFIIKKMQFYDDPRRTQVR